MFFAAVWAALIFAADAAEIIDLANIDPPDIPLVLDYPDSPLYLTNSEAQDHGADIESLLVTEWARMHVGYDPTQVAAGKIGLDIDGDMTVAGNVWLGKYAGGGSGVPDAATSQAIDVNIIGNLSLIGGSMIGIASTSVGGITVKAGGELTMNGGAFFLQGAQDDGQSRVEAGSVVIANGYFGLGSFATLKTTWSNDRLGDTPSLRVTQGGILELGGGTPPWDPTDPWDFRGVDLMSGGTGLAVDAGGILRSVAAGGYITGGVGESVRIAPGGVLDAAEANLVAYDFDDVYLGGSYRAGYNRITGEINHLDAYQSAVTLAETSRLGMTRDLQRSLNSASALNIDAATILRGGSIDFVVESTPVLKTGMGIYHLAVGQNPADDRASLWVERVVDGVKGDGTAEDRARFRANMQNLWSPGRINAGQADNIYNLTAAELPGVFAVNDAGRFNQEVLEAFVDGRDMPVGDKGIADAGLYEMYNGSPMFGVNTVAYNTATEVLNIIGDKLNALDEELAAVHTGASDGALAFLPAPSEYRENRFWVGAFGRTEEAELDYGIAGYSYKPRGVVVGYDRVFGSLALGGALTYARGDYQDKAASRNESKITSYSASAYTGLHHWSGMKAAVFGTYSHLDNEIRDDRGGFTRRADHDSYVWSLGAKLGYDINPAERFRASPSIGVTKIRAVNKEHGERLDGLGVMRIGEMRRDSTLVPVDLEFAFDLFQCNESFLRLTTNLGYAYDFDEGGVLGDIYYEGLQGATGMSAAKRDPGRHRFNFGAGLIWSGARLDVTARYDYYRRSEQDAHQVRGNVGLKF